MSVETVEPEPLPAFAFEPTDSPELATLYRAQQIALADITIAQLDVAWQLLDAKDLDTSWERWSTVAARVGNGARGVSTNLAVQSYLRARVSAGYDVRVPIHKALPVPPEIMQANLKVTGPIHVKQMIHNGNSWDDAMEGGRLTSSATVARMVTDGARDTMVLTVVEDPVATGWQRLTSAKACDFCSMLARRGAVYRSNETASFRAHDHCMCVPWPSFEPKEPRKPRRTRKRRERVEEPFEEE